MRNLEDQIHVAILEVKRPKELVTKTDVQEGQAGERRR
jgi:hypothetical protein